MARKDAKKVKGVKGLNQLSIDLNPKRCDSCVYINQKLDVTNLMKYLAKKKKDNDKITFFHAIITTFGKTMYNRPKMNRFVANRHIYEHKDLVISFVAKQTFKDKSEELMVLVPIKDNDNIDTISKKILDKVNNVRSDKVETSGANKAMDFFGKLPNVVRVPAVGLFKILDKYGILPQTFIDDNIYYSSMIISNLGSIKCGAVNHHLTEFGTVSSLATIGEIKEEKINNKIVKMCEIGVNIDERIADGYYFAKTLKLVQYILDNPELLDETINQKIEVKEVR